MLPSFINTNDNAIVALTRASQTTLAQFVNAFDFSVRSRLMLGIGVADAIDVGTPKRPPRTLEDARRN